MLNRSVSCCIGLLLLGCTLAQAQAQPHAYSLVVNVERIEDRKFVTTASFKLPLKHCQAWRYLIDYDSSTSIPGVLSSKTARLSPNKAQVSLIMEEQILFFKIRMHSVIEFQELKNQGTDFVQIAGDAKSFVGSWRIEPQGDGTLFRYSSVFQPDSALPMVVIQYFFDRRLKANFAAIAQLGASLHDMHCSFSQ